MVLLPPRDVERLRETRFRLFVRTAAVEQRARVHPVQLGVAPVRALTLGAHQTQGGDGEGVVVAADPPQPFCEQHEEAGRSDPDGDLRQLAERVLHLGDSGLEVARVGASAPAEKPSGALEHGKAERCRELHQLLREGQRPVGLAALDVVDRDVQQDVSERERMVEAPRQVDRLLAQEQRPVVIAEVEVAPRQVRVRVDAAVPPQRARERCMLARVVERHGAPVVLRRAREAASIEVRKSRHHVREKQIERIARALRRGQRVTSDRFARGQVALHEVRGREPREHARELW